MNSENQKSKIKYQKQNQISKPSQTWPKTEVKYRAFYLSINIIKFLDRLGQRNYIRIIADQLTRSITSVGANIVEAKASASIS